jgi:hypothetical protein
MSEYVLTTPRPEPSEADQAYWHDVKQAVGPLKSGVVLSVSRELGTGYVKEAETDFLYLLSRRVISAPVFDTLEAGMPVQFRENGNRAVATIKA